MANGKTYEFLLVTYTLTIFIKNFTVKLIENDKQ